MKTIWLLQKAFRDDAMSAAQIKVWHKYFKDGWESVKSDPHSGRPATSRTPESVEHVPAAINKDWWLTVRTRSWSGDSKNYCVWDFDTDFDMKHIVAKFVPWLLLPEQNIVLQLLMMLWELCWGPTVSTLKGTEAPLSYVQCFLYLLQSIPLFFILPGWILYG